VVRRRNCRDEPVLIDWGRARIGSPLEDVSSWLHSLAEWEPEVRRRHDTLFVSYLTARGMDGRLPSDLRAAYWFAGASNAFSGGLLYHLAQMLDQRATSRRRLRAAYSAREWIRVLRRADAFWS
jgi:aminoglycoside phosphotransferase (APT) family kinase protein